MEKRWTTSGLFTKNHWIVFLWLLLPVINWILDFPNDRYNNYKIFSSMFWHLIEQKNLYVAYPSEHGDLFYYGPAFGLIIAPFAILPDLFGGLLWGIFNVLILVFALNKVNLKLETKVLLMLLSTIELANSIWSHQFNASVSAMLILSYALVENETDFYATFWILLGAFTKVYGVIGLVFFVFSKNKVRFVLSCAIWSILLFALPMILSSPEYIVQTYFDWFNALALKNTQLVSSKYSDLSVMGLFRKMTGLTQLSNLWFLITGALALLLPLLRFEQYQSKYFRVLILASLLMFIVLFSTGSEHPTYVICVVGLSLWLVLHEEIFTSRNIAIIGTMLLLTGLGPTYIFSEEVALFILSYKLKALPCIAAWGLLFWDLMTMDFKSRDESAHFRFELKEV